MLWGVLELMKHFIGGGCGLGEEHAGSCVWQEPVTNTPAVTNIVTNASDRVMAWRAANQEKYNAYQRDYMRRRRANVAVEVHP